MGGCLSSNSTDYNSTGGTNRKPCAHVVSAGGKLRQYPVPVTVSQVLQSETSSPESFFLCNSDRLYFNDYIPSLELQEELEQSQIYFVLPTAKLHYRLSASDMAALAVKASIALEQINRRSGNRKSRISPVLVAEVDSYSNNQVNQTKISSSGSNYAFYSSSNRSNREGSKASSARLGVSRSGSVRKLSRYSSRRAKLAVRSFRIKLNTIYEGSVLHLN